MFEVSVSGGFSAAHQLRLADGSLEPLHDHDWHVTATYAGPQLDPAGLLVDFEQVRRELERVLADLDQTNLNVHPALAAVNPSAEQVAVCIARKLMEARSGALLHSVAVEEAPGCVARYVVERVSPPA